MVRSMFASEGVYSMAELEVTLPLGQVGLASEEAAELVQLALKTEGKTRKRYRSADNINVLIAETAYGVLALSSKRRKAKADPNKKNLHFDHIDPRVAKTFDTARLTGVQVKALNRIAKDPHIAAADPELQRQCLEAIAESTGQKGRREYEEYAAIAIQSTPSSELGKILYEGLLRVCGELRRRLRPELVELIDTDQLEHLHDELKKVRLDIDAFLLLKK